MNEPSITSIRKTDAAYPKRFLAFSNMPDVLYVRGNLPDPETKSAAIVGSRSCSPYGSEYAALFAKVLAEHGVQIISGLACGIDAAAHQGCLDGGGKTFAVLGCGIDRCYPRSNYALYRRMLQNGGGILSEYEPGSPPYAYHFPIRNRLISALSDIVLVIEARQKSGSLITASYALEQGVSVYAVPGRISDTLSSGTNALIAQGAVPALSPETILLDLGLIRTKKEETVSPPDDPTLSPSERFLLTFITNEPSSLTLLCEKSGCELQAVSEALLLLELKGHVYQPVPGLYAAAYR